MPDERYDYSSMSEFHQSIYCLLKTQKICGDEEYEKDLQRKALFLGWLDLPRDLRLCPGNIQKVADKIEALTDEQCEDISRWISESELFCIVFRTNFKTMFEQSGKPFPELVI